MGGCDHLQSRHHHRQRHFREAAPVRDGCRVRHRQRQDRTRTRAAHRRATGRDFIRAGAEAMMMRKALLKELLSATLLIGVSKNAPAQTAERELADWVMRLVGCVDIGALSKDEKMM